jgi:hypothetical protein
MAFTLSLAEEAQEVLDGLTDAKQIRKVENCLARLAQNPRHPGLNSHPYSSLDGVFGASVWESYVENNVPGAWRVWWVYGPGRGEITIVLIGRHP